MQIRVLEIIFAELSVSPAPFCTTKMQGTYVHEHAYPVDGGWTDYGEWGACSADCGEGTQTRSRTCTKPAAAHGGAECDGEEDENKPCDSGVPCPGDR